MAITHCLTDETIEQLATGRLDGEALASAVQHLDLCAECRRLVACLAQHGVSATSPTPCANNLSRPSIGRYLILDCLGAGAMGIVYSAYDPDLDRKVALKVLLGETHTSPLVKRLFQEAQAAARLTHPNVITVYDVGVVGERLFIAMELVEGATLAERLQEPGHSASEILDWLMQAGRGLWAAHQVGLAHRDIKPQNILVGNDGRVRVTDFGLASPLPAAALAPDSASAPRGIAGTPRYMAPEQRDGQQGDARSDQYSLALTLLEALTGHLRIEALADAEAKPAASASAWHPPYAHKRLPLALRQVLAKGLATAPEQRYASLAEFVNALALAARPRRRRLGWGALLLTVSAVAAGLGFVVAHDVAEPCRDPTAQLVGVWDEGQRQRAHEALLQTQLPYGDDLYQTLDRAFGDFRQRWQEGYVDVCAALQRPWRSGEGTAERLSCLRQQRQEAAALAEVLTDIDAATASYATGIVDALADLTPCRQDTNATGEASSLSDAWSDGHRDLIKARAQFAAGHYRAARDLAATLASAASARQARDLYAEALLLAADAAAKSADYQDATAKLQQAVWAAETARRDDLAIQAALRLAQVLGGNRYQPDQAMIWLKLAAAKLGRFGGRADAYANLAYTRALLQQRTGHPGAALVLAEQARALYVGSWGSESPRLVPLDRLLGSMHIDLGQLDAALAANRQALALGIATAGPNHPDVALSLTSIGQVLAAQGHIEEGQHYAQQGLAVADAALGPEHPYAAIAHNNLARMHLQQGELATALTHAQQGLAIRRSVYGDDHVHVAGSFVTLAEVYERQGNDAEARQAFVRALAIHEKVLGPEHPTLALSLAGLGRLHKKAQQWSQARQYLERAVAVTAEAPGEPASFASLRLALAQVLMAQEGATAATSNRAQQLARAAYAAYVGLGAAYLMELRAADRWFAQQGWAPTPN